MPFLRRIAEQQADQGAFLWLLRTRLAARAGTRLADFRRVDARLAAHLDGLALAGPAAWALCRRPLRRPTPGECFVAAVVALRLGDEDAIARCLRPGRAPGAVCGAAFARELGAAFEWAAHARACAPGGPTTPTLEPTLAAALEVLATSSRAAHRLAAVDAWARLRWRLSAPAAAMRALDDPHPAVRARAARAAGEFGAPAHRVGDVRARLCRMTGADVAPVARWAAWALIRLGGPRDVAVATLRAPAHERAVRSGSVLALAIAPPGSPDAAGVGDAPVRARTTSWHRILLGAAQGDRRRAAWRRALAQPAEPLFPTSAPAAQQEQLLADVAQLGSHPPT